MPPRSLPEPPRLERVRSNRTRPPCPQVEVRKPRVCLLPSNGGRVFRAECTVSKQRGWGDQPNPKHHLHLGGWVPGRHLLRPRGAGRDAWGQRWEKQAPGSPHIPERAGPQGPLQPHQGAQTTERCVSQLEVRRPGPGCWQGRLRPRPWGGTWAGLSLLWGAAGRLVCSVACRCVAPSPPPSSSGLLSPYVQMSPFHKGPVTGIRGHPKPV